MRVFFPSGEAKDLFPLKVLTPAKAQSGARAALRECYGVVPIVYPIRSAYIVSAMDLDTSCLRHAPGHYISPCLVVFGLWLLDKS